MKFSNGYWLGKDQYIINSPLQVYEAVKVDQSESSRSSDELKVYAAYHEINSRSDMLDVGNSTISVFSPGKDIIGVELKHFDDDKKDPLYELKTSNTEVESTVSDDYAMLTSGDLEIQINLKNKFNVNFNYRGKRITGSEFKAQASITDLSGQKLGEVMHPNTVIGAQSLLPQGQ